MSWEKTIKDFNKSNDRILNFNNELHIVFYVKNILKNHYNFTYEKTIKIHDIKNDESISKDKFFYWWCFQRYDEIIKEEEIIFNKFNNLKNKIDSMIQKLNENINEDNKIKINALNEKLKLEADKSNYSINMLKSFRNMYLTKDSIDKFFSRLKIILENN